MSGGSQHNPNGRQSQLGPGWSPLQLQMANLLARAPQAHMASDRGVTWHTPTPPPHLYHVPAPSPPDPLQAMKNAGSNSVFRHTATPPEMFRHTPTPPDKHLIRHTPSPGDVKTGVALPPVELYSHLGPARDKVVRAEDLLAYARVGVDLSVAGARANGGGALSVRDAPTINSLVGRGAARPPHARVDALLERLAPASPHSVIVHSRVAPTPSPPASDEDSADSCGAPPGSKRKRKPERTIRVPVVPPPPAPPAPAEPPRAAPPLQNGDVERAHDVAPDKPPSPPPPDPHARRKTRSGSAETIDDIAAMIASTDRTAEPEPEPPAPPEPEPVVTVDKLESILASPEPDKPCELEPEPEPEPAPCVPAAPRRRSLRTSNPDAPNVPVESPSEAKPAEPDATEARSAEPTASTYVDVENQLEKMFAGLDGNKSDPDSTRPAEPNQDIPATPAVAKKRRKSAPARGERRAAARSDEGCRRKGPRKKSESSRARKSKDITVRDAYDSGSNASSSRSRGPYIQIRGPRSTAGRSEEERRAARGAARGVARGLHASTLGPRADAATPDATWVCAFCQRRPHDAALGDLFGPYAMDDDCDDYRNSESESRVSEWAWFHEECGVWAPGVVAAGARVWGLGGAVRAARAVRCRVCAGGGAHVACALRTCSRRAHVPCARSAAWTLRDQHFRAYCPEHAPATPDDSPN